MADYWIIFSYLLIPLAILGNRPPCQKMIRDGLGNHDQSELRQVSHRLSLIHFLYAQTSKTLPRRCCLTTSVFSLRFSWSFPPSATFLNFLALKLHSASLCIRFPKSSSFWLGGQSTKLLNSHYIQLHLAHLSSHTSFQRCCYAPCHHHADCSL